MSERFELSNTTIKQIKEIQLMTSMVNKNLLNALKPIIEWNEIYKIQLEPMQLFLQQYQTYISKEFSTIIDFQKSIVSCFEPLKYHLSQYGTVKENLKTLYEISACNISAYENNVEEFPTINEDDKLELKNDFEEISKNENWQQQVFEKITKWKDKNPIIAKVLVFLLISFFSGFIQSFGETAKSAFMYDKPASKSEVIIRLDIQQDIRIINEAPYYYEVETLKDGQLITGWVSKRSIRLKEIEE